MSETKVNATRLYEVTVTETRSATYYVLADTFEAAKDDAKEMGLSPDDWEEDDSDTDVRQVTRRQVLKGTWLWTGGPDGELVNDAVAFAANLPESVDSESPKVSREGMR